jgi:hypothetical protein
MTYFGYFLIGLAIMSGFFCDYNTLDLKRRVERLEERLFLSTLLSTVDTDDPASVHPVDRIAYRAEMMDR